MVTLSLAPIEERISLSALADQQRVSPVSTWRWATRGVRGVVLPTFCVGRKRFTTHQAFESWCALVTAAANGDRLPKEWCHWARNNHVHKQIVQFVEQGPGALDSRGPSPRSWTYASDVLKAWEAGNNRTEEVLAAALAGTLGDNWAVAFLRLYQYGCKPLTANLIIRSYPAHRAVVKRWAADAKLDLIAASLELLKRHLQPQRHFNAVVADAKQKANVERFFSDLPADLKRQVRDWLKHRGFTLLSVPQRQRK